MPLIIRNVEELAVGTIIHGVALDDPTVLHFGILAEIRPDKERPIFFRLARGKVGGIELNYFPEEAAEPKSLFAFEDCRNEFDLLLHRPAA